MVQQTGMSVEVIPVEGIPIIHEGDDLPRIIAGLFTFEDGDILIIASSVYSKSKGHTIELDKIKPSKKAIEIASGTGEDSRFIQVVLDQSEDIILEYPFVLSVLPHGHIGVRAGVDNSNVEKGTAIILPPDPMAAAEEIRDAIYRLTGKDVRTILTDTCGRAFRRGQTGTAIGWSGLPAISDYRGKTDLFGTVLEITEEAVVDEIAGFANFIMGESDRGIPAVVFRGCGSWNGHDEIYFPEETDIIRGLLKKLVDQ